MQNILIISAHADDEVLGMGGTLLRYAAAGRHRIHWLIVTKPWEPKWSKIKIESKKQAIKKVANSINAEELIEWNYKDNLLDKVLKNELQERLISLLENIRPEIIFTPSPWDFNFEHKIVYEIVESSTKPFYSKYIGEIIAYEIPSSTEASFSAADVFRPNLYFNIEEFITEKMMLLKNYQYEMHEFPHPRSEKYIEAIATLRGAESGLRYAEAFHALRMIRK